MKNIDAIDLVRLANVCGGADAEPPSVMAGRLHMGWAGGHYNGMYKKLHDCAVHNRCEAPNRMQAGAGLGALGKSAGEIADRLQGQSLGGDHDNH